LSSATCLHDFTFLRNVYVLSSDHVFLVVKLCSDHVFLCRTDCPSDTFSLPKAGTAVFQTAAASAPQVNWYLHEIGTPFEMKAPRDPSNPHPFGQVPALRDDGGVEVRCLVSLFVSPQICKDHVEGGWCRCCSLPLCSEGLV
jgi:hypothetical protein